MSHTINQLYFGGSNATTGEIGIEVELEGENLPTSVAGKAKTAKEAGIPSLWKVENDGSLRGEAKEYVLRAPIPRDLVQTALDQLDKALKPATLIDSGRAGVHVHLNVLPLTQVQVLRVALLYLIFEQPLVKFCGPTREGNLFCLRASDAEYLLFALNRVINHRNFNQLLQQRELRYSSLNFFSLNKFGSLEFRAMRSPVESAIINKWIEILLRLKDHALTFQGSSLDLLSDISSLGGEDFAYQVLKEDARELGKTWGEDVKRGMRLIQPLLSGLNSWEKGIPMKKQEETKAKKLSGSTNFLNMPVAPPGFIAHYTNPIADARHPTLDEWVRNAQPQPARYEIDGNGDVVRLREPIAPMPPAMRIDPRAWGATPEEAPPPAPVPSPDVFSGANSVALNHALRRIQLVRAAPRTYVSKDDLEHCLRFGTTVGGFDNYRDAQNMVERPERYKWDYPTEWITEEEIEWSKHSIRAVDIETRNSIRTLLVTELRIDRPVGSKRTAVLKKSLAYFDRVTITLDKIKRNREAHATCIANQWMRKASNYDAALAVLEENFNALEV